MPIYLQQPDCERFQFHFWSIISVKSSRPFFRLHAQHGKHFIEKRVLVCFGDHFGHNHIHALIEELPKLILPHRVKADGTGLRPDLTVVHHDRIDPAKADFQPCEQLFRICVVWMVLDHLRQKGPKQAVLFRASGPGDLNGQITAFRDVEQMLSVPFGHGDQLFPVTAHDEEVVTHAATSFSAAASLRRFWAATNSDRIVA